jgi:hypothetical protein
MTYFIKNGNTFQVSSKEAMDLHETLPAKNYVVKQDDQGNFYLEAIDSFQAPSKIYGDCTRNTNRIINTFLNRSGSTGVMLTGEKGSGKTLLTKNICMSLAEQGIPSIIINAPFRGDEFNTLIQKIEQPCVILFDEFEKVYDSEKQEKILTLLDGVFPSKKLFLLTCNDKWRVDQHMRNRPGRIYYMLDFTGLDESFIREYCQDNLQYPEYTDKICTIAGMFSNFNFDMLKAMVAEINLYNESPQQAIRMLNIKPEFDSGSRFSIETYYKGKNVSDDDDPEFRGNPLYQNLRVAFDPDPQNPESELVTHTFTHENLTSVNIKTGSFVFESSDGNIRLVLNKIVEKHFDLGAF